jgi:hypothetical protein
MYIRKSHPPIYLKEALSLKREEMMKKYKEYMFSISFPLRRGTKGDVVQNIPLP